MAKVPSKFILASASPRRIELLKQALLKFEVMAPDLDETPLPNETARAMVMRLAREKAISVAKRLGHEKSALILAADTTVVSPDGKTALGKPLNKKDALRIVSQLQGSTHTVFTSYSILKLEKGNILKQKTKVVQSKVTMRSLTKKQITRYILTQEPMDKAGAYAAQGIGMVLIEKILGSYTNVVGLPMTQVLSDLETDFGLPLFGSSKNEPL